MAYSDLHTHTVFSDGKNTVEEMVREAIRRNMVSIGISDHSYTEFDTSYCMKKEALPAYLEEIQRVKIAYEGQIQVYAGLEYDGYSELENRGDFDYLIGDCHYIKTCDGYFSVDHTKDGQWQTIENYFDRDAMAYARAYYEAYVGCTQNHRPDILGHFDLVSKFGFVDETGREYRAMAIEAMIACLEVTPIVEMNTGPISRGWRNYAFPNTFLLKEIFAHGGKVILSSDSHRPDTLTGYFEESAGLLRQAGFDSMMIFTNGQFEEIGLV